MKKVIIHTEKEVREFEDRLNNLKDKNLTSSKLRIQNLALHFRDNIIEADDKETAEALMVQLEETDVELTEVRFEMLLDNLRQRRDSILKATDWLFMSDVIVEKKARKIYMEYRQYLRDRPNKIRNEEEIYIEKLRSYMKREYPEEFLDGGRAEKILSRFYYYIKGEL